MNLLLALILTAIVWIVVHGAWARGAGLTAAWKRIGKAFLRLIRDRREMALFALWEIVAIAALALVLAVFGPRVGIFALLGAVGLFAIWATRPPTKRR